MKLVFAPAVLAMALFVASSPAHAKGCQKGAAVGAVS
jgi:hypothetical protein